MIHLHKVQKQAKLTHAFGSSDSGGPWGNGSNGELIVGGFLENC